jgi:hypothetical protein
MFSRKTRIPKWAKRAKGLAASPKWQGASLRARRACDQRVQIYPGVFPTVADRAFAGFLVPTSEFG